MPVFRTLASRIVVIGFAALLSALSAEGQSAPTAVVAPAPPPEPIYWRQNLFLIPYQWTSATDPSSAKEVWLYVSKDRGATWQQISKALPQVRAFNYHAEADGEFWFAIRTVDAQDHFWPDSPMQAELKVIVDTTIPRFGDLSGAMRDGDTLDIHWQIADANLDPATCKIEVQTDSAGPWQAIPQASSTPPSDGVFEGKTAYQLPAGCRTAALRATAYDRAGNRALFQAIAAPNGISAIAPSQNISQMPTLISGRGDGEAIASTRPSNDSTPAPPVPPHAALPIQNPSGWVSILAPPAAAKVDDHPAVAQPWPADNRPAGNHLVAFGNRQFDSHSNSSPAAADRSPFVPLEPFRERTAAISAGWTTGATPRWVSSRTFALEYELSDIGQRGVAKVELWGTRDNGQTWRSFAVDDDNRSPLQVTVDEEGVYGFRIVVEAAGGPGGFAPRSGDRPELLIGVDLHRPHVELQGAEPGHGDLAGRLIVRWEASDENLEPRPIGLFYSSRPMGPWSTIATSLENTGQYDWAVGREVPSQVYLRVEARDLAGNLAAFQTSQPVALDLPQPTALPGAVEPLGPTVSVPTAGYR